MAKLKKIETGLRPEVRQPTRKLNIFQRGVKGIIHFIRPIKPELSNTATDPETSGSTNPEPVEDDGNTTSSSGGTTITDPGGSTSGTDPGADPTNPVNTEDMETFIGEIKMFAGNFAPRGWAFCEGQTLDIASHQALYSLIGTTYGGDGRVNFKLPE